MNKFAIPMASALALVLLLASSAGLVAATGIRPGEDLPAPAMLEEDVRNYIPIQGRLADVGGSPLTGSYEITFRLYDVENGGTALCSDTNMVTVTGGLFTSAILGDCAGDVHGQQLWVSLQVTGDSEMAPRQPIYAVPYAWSLRPNSDIIGWVGPGAILDIENWDPAGRGLRSYAMAETGENFGVVGAARSPGGYGGYFYNNNATSGVGLYASSTAGVAIQAGGSGVIQSAANSYVWVSGNGIRLFNHANDAYIDMDTVGGAKVTCGASGNDVNVMLPITVTGPLYGQDVKVTGLDLYYVGTEFDGIQAVLLRRQTGVCDTGDCYASLLDHHTFLGCDHNVSDTGCSRHWDLTTNNVLTEESGILYLTIEINFGGAGGWVKIGGARLTLEHD